MFDEILNKAFEWLFVTYPVVGVGFAVLGGLFTLLEMFVNATEGEEDNKKLTKFMNGYVGRLIRVIQKFTPSIFKKK